MTKFISIKNINGKVFILFISLFLSACGSSAGGVSNGVGGTGITMGRVTGFGSMLVNGVKFNTDNATFIRDGVGSKKQEDFNTGEIVSIKGTVDAGRKTGTATEVTFSDLLEGTITSVPTKNSVEILGQNVITNNLTIFHGFNKLTDLKIGNIVEVSGFSISNNITASSIQLIDSSFTTGSTLEVEGSISDINRDELTFKINALNIDYSTATFTGTSTESLNNGDFLIINANQDIVNNTLIATEINSINTDLETDTYYEIEGFVTDFNSVTSFKIDDEVNITSNTNTLITNGILSDIKLNQLLIIIGTTNASGVLLADEIRVFDSSNSTDIEAQIESINLSQNSLTILGQKVEVDSFTLISDDTTEDFTSLDLNDFAVGDSVLLTVYKNEGKYIASRLSKIETILSVYLVGIVSTVDTNLQDLTLFNNTITTNSSSEFYTENSDSVSASTFFSLLEEGKTDIAITGTYTVNSEIDATDITIISNQ